MTLSLIRRPEKPLTPDLDSIFTAASSPVVYRFERQDFIISFIGASITNPGFYAVFLAGEHDEELFLGTLVHVNGIDTATGARIFIPTSSVLDVVYNGGSDETEISISEPFFGVLGDSGFCNNLSRTNYFVEVQIFVTETGREIFQTRLKYFPTVIGIVIVDLSSLVNSFLDPETPFDSQFFTKANSILLAGTFSFYISYQERYDGSLTGPIDDSGNPQIATNSVRQILESASPNMLPFVPFEQDLGQLLLNPGFNTFANWQNGGLGFGVWEIGPGNFARMQGIGEAVGTVSRTLTQNLFTNIGPFIWHESVYKIDIKVNMDAGENAALQFVDINDDELQEDFRPGILVDDFGDQIDNRIPINDQVQELTINYQPSQNSTRIGVRVLSTVIEPTITIDVDEFFFQLPLPRYLTREGELKAWRGWPFTLAFIYSDLILFDDLKSVEEQLDINGNLINTIERPLDNSGALKINVQNFTKDLPEEVAFIDATIRTLTDEVIIETKRIRILEPCINPVYLQWSNALGGLDYWMFDFSQEISNQHIGNRKFNQTLCQAENISRTEYEAIDWLNHPGQVTDLRRVDPDFTLQDKTERRSGFQAYVLDTDRSGDKKGIIVEPFISPVITRNSTHRIQIRFISPEQFVTQ